MIKTPDERDILQRNRRVGLILVLSLMLLYAIAVAGVIFLN
jgi:hypothetical protein